MMTKAVSKSERIRDKIAESEAPLPSEDQVPAARQLEPAPPEKFSNLVSEYPGLAIAAGLGLGLLAGAVLPRSTGRKLLRGGVFVVSTAGELGLAFGKQAIRKADDVTRDSRELIGDTAAKAGRLASDAGHKAADAGRKAADVSREASSGAQRLAEDATERVRDLGTGLAKLAVEAAARLRK